VDPAARALAAAFGPGWVIRTQGKIGLDEESEPEPDVAVVPGTLDDYREAHPARPVLTLEIADSSLGSDRERKGSLYARAGPPDYWVLNLPDRVLEVYREPVAATARPSAGGTARRGVAPASGRVAPLAGAGATVAVADLLP
jgi:Uma2 family endonuclease